MDDKKYKFFGQNRELQKLYKWLNYELPGGILFLASIMHDVAFYIFFILVIIFSPFMGSILFSQKKIGWIVSFIAISLGSITCYIAISVDTTMGETLLRMSIMATFLLYFFCLKVSLPSMID